jgi:hypothetical protein
MLTKIIALIIYEIQTELHRLQALDGQDPSEVHDCTAAQVELAPDDRQGHAFGFGHPARRGQSF